MKSESVFFSKSKTVFVDEIDLRDPEPDEIQAMTFINGICMFEVWQYNHMLFKENTIPGHEGIGVVSKTGRNVKSVKEGDLITGSGWKWSKYINLKEEDVVKITCNPDDIDSYLVEPVSCAVNACSFIDFYPGDRVILFGAGYMGLLLAQVLKYHPISQLTVVDIKPANLELAREIGGADEIINLADEQGEKRLQEFSREAFDISYECSGAVEPLEWCNNLTARGGSIGVFAWHHDTRNFNTTTWHAKGLRIINVAPAITVNEKKLRSYQGAERLMAAGKIQQQKLITHKYSLSEVEKAMQESSLREGNFIKSIIKF